MIQYYKNKHLELRRLRRNICKMPWYKQMFYRWRLRKYRLEMADIESKLAELRERDAGEN